MKQIEVIDSHTAGEPTRIIVDGGPPLSPGTLKDRREQMRVEFDRFRTAVINEPRGSDVLVGGLMCEPHDPTCSAAVIFFNNASYLGMCGHGMIGFVETLHYLDRIQHGEHRIETPAGVVSAELTEAGVAITNVPSFLVAGDISLEIRSSAGGAPTIVTGDIAWGGNWFFVVKQPEFDLTFSRDNVRHLLSLTGQIRHSLSEAGFGHVDHVELFAAPSTDQADSRNFVLCPGFEYDRSPCGTGTSAKLACLAAAGKLNPGQSFVQEGILGTCFEASYTLGDERELDDSIGYQPAGPVIRPRIASQAYITAHNKLIIGEEDPFAWGIA